MTNVLRPEEISLSLYQNVPMRDGIELAANIYMPETMEEPLPAIMVLTPYFSDLNVERGMYYARRGYVFVSVESRGRGNSEGRYTPFINEGKDGYDAVEWIAGQPWCDGRVGLMGGSYKGMVQWLIARENPPHLVSMAPTATVCPGIDATRDRNIYRTFNLQILTLISGRGLNANLSFSDYTKSRIRRYYETGSAYADLLKDNLQTDDNHFQDVFEAWIAHPTFDNYWKTILPAPADYARMNLPILSITGYFDDDQPGHMYYYREFQKYASDEAKEKLYFVIGPWDHGGTRRAPAAYGGVDFGESAAMDMLDLHRQWFDWTLKEGGKPQFLSDNVRHFHMGLNEWLASDGLPNTRDQERHLYLAGDNHNPDDVYHSAKLLEQPAAGDIAHCLRYDPRELADKDAHVTGNHWDNFLVSKAYLQEPGWLYYHSAPLDEDLAVCGHITLNAYFEIDTPDTDFTYKLYEISPDGASLFLAEGVMRARFRESLEREQLVTPGSVNLYAFQSLYLLSRRLQKGNRLRLLVGYMDGSGYQKNYNTGGDVSQETAGAGLVCNIKLHCSEQYPSSLALPVFEP